MTVKNWPTDRPLLQTTFSIACMSITEHCVYATESGEAMIQKSGQKKGQKSDLHWIMSDFSITTIIAAERLLYWQSCHGSAISWGGVLWLTLQGNTMKLFTIKCEIAARLKCFLRWSVSHYTEKHFLKLNKATMTACMKLKKQTRKKKKNML